MGLLRSHNHFHSHDNRVSVRFPDTIKVEEHRAPTDESIRMAEEMYKKVMDNLVSKVKVEDNIVNGEAYAFRSMNYSTIDPEIVLRFKFKINGREFDIERKLNERELFWDQEKMMVIENFDAHINDLAKSVMLYYAMKVFSLSVYEQISNSPFPSEFLQKFLSQ